MRDAVAHTAQAGLGGAEDGYGHCRLDREGNLVTLDDAAARMLGLQAAGTQPRRLWDAVPTLADSALQRHCTAVLDGAGAQLFLFHHAARDGWFIVAAEPVGPGTGPDAVDLRLRDAGADPGLADRIAAERLDAAAQVAGRLAHDFNNCLTVVLGNAEYLADLVADQPELAETVGMIATAGERAASLTSRVLQFARHRRPQPDRVEVAPFLEKLAAKLRRDAPAWPVEVSAPPGIPDAAVSESGLEGALRELAANARDAMPTGGTVRLFAEPAGPGARIRIGVADLGPGLDPAMQQRCREPFVTTRSDRFGGGLGLSVVHGFATSSGGALLFESGPGLRAVLDLPGEPAGVAGPPPHVLMVEDDAANRIGIAGMLGALGYGVTATATAAEALHALRSAAPGTLLLADVVLPGDLDGARLVEEARRLRPAMPALLMSGYAVRLGDGEAAREGGVRLLAKPFRRADLARALAAAFAEAAEQNIAIPPLVPA